MYRFKKDKYQKTRGGSSRVLNICCESCGAHVAYYQKDGPGPLKRMYVDRFINLEPGAESLNCSGCQAVLGARYVYEKEKRSAYRLFVGAVTKKIIKISSL